uniref:DNA topoisomerase type IA zn finger domain-containing protein n=2 Tax=cellular organisms TaxID=131567 RepID=U9TN39_RHIID
MVAEGAAGGFVVTSGRYTAEATGFAKGRNIQLVDGSLLKHWIAHHSTSEFRSDIRDKETAASTSSAPLCPVCNESMKIRLARRGLNAGEKFWGCARFPNCRGVRKII